MKNGTFRRQSKESPLFKNIFFWMDVSCWFLSFVILKIFLFVFFKLLLMAFLEMVLTAEHKIQGRGWIQIQLLPPYIYLNLPVSTPWSLNPPIPTPKPTHLHPLDVDPAPPPGSLFCSEGLLHFFGICLSLFLPWGQSSTSVLSDHNILQDAFLFCRMTLLTKVWLLLLLYILE